MTSYHIDARRSLAARFQVGFSGETVETVKGGPPLSDTLPKSRVSYEKGIRPVSHNGSRSPAISDAGLEAFSGSALTLAPFSRRKVAALRASLFEVLAAPPNAGAATVANLSLSRCEYTDANREQ